MHKASSLIFGLTLFVLSGSALASPPANPVLNSSEFSLQQYQGQLLYLDFWASWCSPCKASFPFMEHLEAAYGDDGLKVIAVNVDSESAAALRFLKQQRTHFTVVMNPSGSLAAEFKVLGMPSSYLIDGSGKVIWEHKGFRSKDREMIEGRIRQALSEFKRDTDVAMMERQP